MLRFPIIGLFLCAGFATAEIPVIPRPAKVEEKKDQPGYKLPGYARVRMDKFSGGPEALAALQGSVTIARPVAAKEGEEAQIVVKRAADAPKGEGYRLEVSAKGVLVTAADDAGLFYGSQTLAQMIRTSGGGASGFGSGGNGPDFSNYRLLPIVSAEDAPRFAWRGYMLDESRHFSGEETVKRLLDAMARYKLNRFHWHLTDSAGWRIEIKKYPNLTTVGGKGNETDGPDKAPAQFYTQEQIKGIVAYAKARHITVIPEIDMPGHADAAVLAYPEHDGGGMIQKGNPRKWPNFTFNPAKKETLAFLDDILKEVSTLFPDAGMIHFGGDEVHFGWHKWPNIPEVRELMEREKLKDNAAVETWFNRRMARTINQLGFKTAGWDEIVDRDLPKDQTVIFWWRHDKPAVLRKALDLGYPVVLCPRRPCYFDFLQDPSHKSGRTWGGINVLSDVYNFPAGLKLSEKDEKQALGIQACLWTETAVSQARRDFLTWPRLVALAEAGWTPEARKDFASFEAKLPREIDWLKVNGIQTWDPVAKPEEVSDKGAKPVYPDNPE